MPERTKDWDLYEAGVQYNNKLQPSYYDTVDANIAFFNGDQWRNLKTEKMPKPVFNIIKRVISFFVASLTTSKAAIHFEPLVYADEEQTPEMESEAEAAEIADAQVENLFDKLKMEFRIKEALFDAAITGDAAAHLYWDVNKKPFGPKSDVRGEVCFELVDGSNVFFGNANNPKVDAQPYIIISGRDMVKNLKEEAKRYQQESENITEDYQTEYMAGDAGQIEVEADEYGKALYIIIYRKKKVAREIMDEMTGEPKTDEEGNVLTEEVETITASKSVENAYIYQDIDTGLSHYPVAWLNWEKQKNQYHGRAICTGILPNQIFINRMFAMVMYHLMMTAFPKGVYNADVIQSWNNEIGTAIPVRGMGPDANIKNLAGYLEPANMSNKITEVINLAMEFTKETLGVSDAAMGQVDPKNTSAIIAVQKASAVPLENPKSNLYEWIEDIGRILFDFMGTYYGNRPVSMEVEGQRVLKDFDFSQMKDMWLEVKADVGESSYWSEIAAVQTLDNLLANEKIEFIDYLERVPDEYIPRKEELITKLKEQMEQANDPMALVQQLPPEEQQAFMNAPPEVQQQILAQLQAEMGAPQQAPM